MYFLSTGFDAFKEELGPSRDSTLPRGMSLDVSYDEQDIMKVRVSRYTITARPARPAVHVRAGALTAGGQTENDEPTS